MAVAIQRMAVTEKGVRMYKARRRLVLIGANSVLAIIFVLLALFLLPQVKVNDYNTYTIAFPTVVSGILFFLLLLAVTTMYDTARASIEKTTMETGETAFLTKFIDKLRFCYSLDDFYTAISSILEEKADCSVLYVDRRNNYVLYNSPNRLTCGKETMDKLAQNYPKSWGNGIYFLGDELGIVSSIKKARGFFMVNGGLHLYIFCRYTRLFDREIYPRLFEEFCRFQTRTNTINDLSEIAELSKEWEQLAETQRSFLPQTMPTVKRVSFASYFRPLVNVSGDYYSVLPIDENKTLVMLGDVSGKGLPAALIMGLVMNTVKIKENKEDLVSMLNAVDVSIKNMHLQDKYTVLFIGIIDTQKMTIRYINASMSDPIIVTRSPDGYIIKPLSSNCSVVGIIPLDDVHVAEQRLFSGDLILMASDGVSEVMDDNNVELGDSKIYLDTIKASASKAPQEFVNDIVNLVMTYNGNKKLRDDVTMLVAKLKG
jgi:serine phosphatase RsbU (regulator of sigma subunit)